MSEMERNPEVPASTRDEAGFIPAAMFEESLGDPLNAKGDLTFLRRNERVPQVTCNSRGMLSFPPQLHANHEILPCMLEEALIRFSLSKESPCSILELERVLVHFMKLQKFPQIPFPTLEDH